MRKIWLWGFLILWAGCSMNGSQDTEQAKAVAGKFITLLYQSDENISSAYALTSKNYQAVANQGMTRRLRNVAGEVVGNYIRHDEGNDVTRLLASNAPSTGRIIRFNVAYQDDPDGQILVTMTKENGAWKVMGFNINSPKLTEKQAKGMLQTSAQQPANQSF